MDEELKCSDCGGQIRVGELYLLKEKAQDGTVKRRWVCVQCWKFWHGVSDGVELPNESEKAQ